VENAFKSEYESWKNQKYYERMQKKRMRIKMKGVIK
jgi:hypothetical protein